jgi:hypothetical protein
MTASVIAIEGVGGSGFTTYYALTGYIGWRATSSISSNGSDSHARGSRGLAIAFLHNGPRQRNDREDAGGPPVDRANNTGTVLTGWAPDPEAFRFALDFSSKMLTPDKLRMFEPWVRALSRRGPGVRWRHGATQPGC